MRSTGPLLRGFEWMRLASSVVMLVLIALMIARFRKPSAAPSPPENALPQAVLAPPPTARGGTSSTPAITDEDRRHEGEAPGLGRKRARGSQHAGFVDVEAAVVVLDVMVEEQLAEGWMELECIGPGVEP